MAAPGDFVARILAIDDDPYVLESLEWILKPVGYDVVRAESGEQALELLAQNKFDLILLDYSMRGIKGGELSRIVKERHPEMPIILVTAYAEMVECAIPPVKSVDSIIGKPFLAGELRDTVALFLRKKDASGATNMQKEE